MAGSDLNIDALVAGRDQPLVVAEADAILVLAFNRPQVRNALSNEVRRLFAEAIKRAEEDPAIGAVIITGAHGVFSGGLDLKEYLADPKAELFRPHPGEVLRATTKPVIAAVDGPCITGGLEIALNSSFIIATDRARFADTHAKVGFVPAWGMSALLPRAIGLRRARQMSLTGEPIDAARAYEWGLVNEVVSPEQLMPRSLELARAMLACDAWSVREQLALSVRSDGIPFSAALEAEDELVAAFFSRSA